MLNLLEAGAGSIVVIRLFHRGVPPKEFFFVLYEAKRFRKCRVKRDTLSALNRFFLGTSSRFSPLVTTIIQGIRAILRVLTIVEKKRHYFGQTFRQAIDADLTSEIL